MTVCAYAQTAQSPQELVQDAQAAQQAGDLERAVKEYRAFLSKYPNIPEIRSNLGASLAGLSRYPEAILEYKLALKLRPDPLVRMNLALAYYKSSELLPAIGELKKVLTVAPSNVQATTLLADCYLRIGKNKEVIALLSQAGSSQAFDYMLGTALIRDGQLEKGQEVIDRILKNGDSAEAHFLMGATKYRLGDFLEALADLKKAVEQNSALPDLYSYYGQVLLVTGDQAGAREAFLKELQANPGNFEANLRLGVLFRQDNLNDDALRYFKEALKIRPDDAAVRYQIAALKVANGQTVEARRELEALVKDEPDFLEAHVSLATAYFREGNKNAAIRERAVVAKLNEARQAKNESVTDYPAEVKRLALAAEQTPNDARTQSDYGKALLNTGDPDAALSAFRKAIALDPSDYEANLRAGQILLVRKQFEQATPLLRQTVRSRPESTEAQSALAKALKRDTRGVEAKGVGQTAPDFALSEVGTGKVVRLRDFHKKVVLVFGSYSCPNLRASAEALKALEKRYGARVPFLLIYIREAHAQGDWQSGRNEREHIEIAPATTIEEKREHAAMCSRKLHLPFRALVDGMDGAVEEAYQAWPSRVVVIGADKKMVFNSGLTEQEFRQEELEKALR